ncbi:MAG TPA: aminoacyl-tRNA hydrolase [Acidobacteriota bacterium]|nr:aminoacyl-tRNA hydrolase [Acidobacteriota bacterium]
MLRNDPVKIIVGLGNPGKRYARNRHNVGCMVLDALARDASSDWTRYLLTWICRMEMGTHPVLLAEPLTYMNHSGKAVHALLSALDRSPRDLLVLIDDLNLPLGRIRIRERGSSGGHNGLQSVIETLNDDTFLRIRMGIGEERMPADKTGFVLSDFSPEQQDELNNMISKTGNAIKSLLNDGVAKTMAIYNA